MIQVESFAVRPKEVPLIWGGRALVRRFGKPGDPNEAIGESWECFDENLVSRGPYAGRTIAQLRIEIGRPFVGALDPLLPFPILTKFIDAQQPLSVQVHPDDAYAQRVEHQSNGKTECWVILDAEPGAEIVLGWARDTSRDEYLRRVADGTLGELLRRVAVKPGDVFYLPAGTVHSIGAGIILYETQQTSDLTYRIFDWNRVGADGKPRELHVEKAADVLDYRASQAGALVPLVYVAGDLRRTVLVADRRFIVERVAVDDAPGRLELAGMPLIVTAQDAPVTLTANGAALELAPYETALAPAALGAVVVRAPSAPTSVLAIAPVEGPGALRDRLAGTGVAADRVALFVAQFEP
jgi:mannose-6-phosphate isomerase